MRHSSVVLALSRAAVSGDPVEGKHHVPRLIQKLAADGATEEVEMPGFEASQTFMLDIPREGWTAA